MKPFIKMAFYLMVISLAGACSNSSTNNPGTSTSPDFSKLTPSCFQANSSPLLTGNSLFSGSDWNDPSVLKVGNQYVMYASSDHSFDLDIGIYRMVSDDGMTWTLSPSSPVLTKGSGASDWDHASVETPSVIYFNGQYHLFYTGYPASYTDSGSYKIGHAVSNDGIVWTKDASYLLAPTDPTGAPNLDFNQFVVAEPGAVVFNNKIYLYFTALGANADVGTTLQVIGLVTSSDGITWSTPESALVPNQSLYPRSTWAGYSTPQPVVLNNQIHLFFDVVQASPWKQLRIHHASSADGKTNWNLDSSEIYSQTNFSWTSNEIRAPAALLDGADLHLWFAGDNGSVLGIGKALCPL